MNKKILSLFLFIILINLILNGRFQLHYDEAYYWAFSQDLSLSYFDHPPVIAYLIRLFSIFGHSEFSVRLVGLVTTIITVLMMYSLAKRMFGQKTADITLILTLASPLINAVFFITTPDIPLLMFWAITLLCFYIGVFDGKTKYIYFAGFFAGCALLSKYTAVLMFPPLMLFLVFSPNYRKYLLKKELYLAFILAFIVFSPVIYWNYQHGWVSFKFQFHHGVNLDDKFSLSSLGEHVGDYLGGQILIGGIFIFIPLLLYAIKYVTLNIKDDKLAFLFWPTVFVFVFFGYRALFQHMEANWPAPLYISGIILVAYYLAINDIRWVYKTAICLMVVFIFILKFPLDFIPKKYHNLESLKVVNAFYGSKELLDQVKPYIGKNDVLLACDYGNASRAWFYLGKRAYVLGNFRFGHMYQYWNNKLPDVIPSAIYICDNIDNTALDSLKADFKSVALINVANFDNVVGIRRMYIYKAIN